MAHSKFFTFLSALKEPEFKSFQRLLNQRHHKDAIPLQVFEFLKNHLKGLEPGKKDFTALEDLTLEQLRTRIFKKGKIPPTRTLSDTLSDLNLSLKDFLVAEKLKSSALTQQMLWLQVLADHHLETDLIRETQLFYKQKGKSDPQKMSDCLDIWAANYWQREQLALNKKKLNIPGIRQCAASMEDCWEVIRLKMAYETNLLLLSKSKGLVAESDSAKSAPKVKPLLLKTFYAQLLEFSRTNDDTQYDKIEKLLQQKGKGIAPEELNEIIMFLKNYIGPQIRNDQEQAGSRKLHRLNLIGLQYNLFTRNGILSALEFPNIVNMACAAGDIEWARHFVKTYTGKLHKTVQANTELLSNAIIAFAQGNFKDVLSLLENHPFASYPEELRAKCLILRSYYELPEYSNQVVEYCIKLGDQIRKKPKSEPNNAAYRFVQIVKLLAGRRTSITLLNKRVDDPRQIYFRTWLREKISSYEKTHATRRYKRL